MKHPLPHIFLPTALLILAAGCGAHQGAADTSLSTSATTATGSSGTSAATGGSTAPSNAGAAIDCNTAVSPNAVATNPNASGLAYSDNIVVTLSTRSPGQAAHVYVVTDENVTRWTGDTGISPTTTGDAKIGGAGAQNVVEFNATVKSLETSFSSQPENILQYHYTDSVAHVWIDTNRNGNCDEPTYLHTMNLLSGPATDADAIYGTAATTIDIAKMQVDPDGCANFPGFFIAYSDNIVLTDQAGTAKASAKMAAFVMDTFGGVDQAEPVLQATPADGTSQLLWPRVTMLYSQYYAPPLPSQQRCMHGST